MHENSRIFVSSYTLRKCSKTVDFIHFRRYNTNGNRMIFFQYFIRFLKLYESIGEYKMREKIKNFTAMSGATLLIAVGTYFFKFPNNFTFGGITGLAVLIAKTGLISAADFSFVANMSLLILGAMILGKKFVAKTAYCSVLLSFALSLFERIFPMNQPFTNQPMLEVMFAIALPALGSAILFNIGSSSGGTDIIAMILKKFTSVDIGRALVCSDVAITVAGFFIFDVKTGLYSL